MADGYDIVMNGKEYHFDSLPVRISATETDDGYIQLYLRFLQESYKYLDRPDYLRFKYFPNKIGIVPEYSEPANEEDYVTVNQQTVSISSFQGAKNRTIKPGKYDIEYNAESKSFEFIPVTLPKPMLRNHDKFIVDREEYQGGEAEALESFSD